MRLCALSSDECHSILSLEELGLAGGIRLIIKQCWKSSYQGARRKSRRASDDADPAQTVQQYSGGVTESWTVRMNGTIHGE